MKYSKVLNKVDWLLLVLADKKNMEKKKKNKQQQQIKGSKSGKSIISTVSPSQSFFLHLLCGLGLASAVWVAQNIYSVNLIANPAQTLRLIWVLPLSLCTSSLFENIFILTLFGSDCISI